MPCCHVHSPHVYKCGPTSFSPSFTVAQHRRYLFKSNSQGVEDYLCNRIYGLPEEGIERYLSQLATLVVQRQSASLDKMLVDLCARALRIAVKVGGGCL